MSIARNALFLGFILFAGSAQAIQINASGTGLAGPDTTITFDDLAPGEIVAPDRYAAQGVALNGLSLVGFNAFAFPGFTGTWINAGGSANPPDNLLEISFAGTVTGAAFRFVTNPGTSTFTALLNGAVVDTFDGATTINNPSNWFGFDNLVFDTLRVLPGGTNGAHHIENLQFAGLVAAAPAPATLTLLALGLAGLGCRRRRR